MLGGIKYKIREANDIIQGAINGTNTKHMGARTCDVAHETGSVSRHYLVQWPCALIT